MLNYVCALKSYPNCRVHDGGYEHGLKFFREMQDVFDFALKEKSYLELGDIYDTNSGTLYGKVTYELSHHNVSGIMIEYGENLRMKFRTKDDGHGNMVWDCIKGE